MSPLLNTDRWTRAAFLLAVVSALGISLWTSREPVSIEVLLKVAVGGALYVALGLYGAEFCDWKQSLPLSIGYMALQLILAAFVLEEIYGLNTLSIAWIILLPLVGQSLSLLPRLGTWIVATLSLVIFLRLIVLLGGWREAPAAAGAFLASCAFVVGFTQLALSAGRARLASARLAKELAEARQQISEYAAEATELATGKEQTPKEN